MFMYKKKICSIQIHFVVLDPHSFYGVLDPDSFSGVLDPDPYFSPWIRIRFLVFCIRIFSRFYMDLFIVLLNPDPYFFALGQGFVVFFPYYDSFICSMVYL